VCVLPLSKQFADTKEICRSHTSKNRQYNGQKEEKRAKDMHIFRLIRTLELVL
jgi:hypothetical protein